MLTLTVLAIVFCNLLCASAVPRRALLPSIVAQGSVAGRTEAGGQNKVISTVTTAALRLVAGVSSIPSNFQKEQRLKKKRREQGDAALSYAEFKFLENVKDDLGKIFRAGLFCAASPEYFFYTYLVIPIMSSGSNPWAWRTLPSGFDTEDDLDARDRVCVQRRQAALVTGLVHLFSGCSEDTDEKTRDKRVSQLAMIQDALQAYSSKGIAEALNVLDPWLAVGRAGRPAAASTASNNDQAGAKGKASRSRGRNAPSSQPQKPVQPQNQQQQQKQQQQKKKQQQSKAKLDIPEVPWVTIKEMCRAMGVDGVPNIYILRMLNRGELINLFDRVRNSDEYLAAAGRLDALDEDEVVSCCIERCISVDPSKTDKALRHDLKEWIDAAIADDGRNEQNKRLAMAALHVSRDLSKDGGGLGPLLKASLKG
jgi:hypothetical protein